MSESERRINLHDEIDELKILITSHISLFDNHVEHFKEHEMEEKKNYTEILTKVNEACDNTKGLVELWNAATGTIRVISAIGSIIKWCSGIAIGVGILWAMIHGTIPSGK